MTQSPSIETILADHGPFLRGLARALVSDDHLVDDLVQETWSVAMTSPRSPAADPAANARSRGSARAWLATVLRQLTYSHFRRSSVGNTSALPEDHAGHQEDAAAMTERLERDSLVHEALNAMQEPYRSVLVFRYHDGLRTSEIAKRMGVSESTVRTRLERGRDRMRAALDLAYGEAEDPRAAWLAAFAPLLVPSPAAGVPAAVAKVGSRFAAPSGSLLLIASVVLVSLGAVFVALSRGGWSSGSGDPKDAEKTASVSAPSLPEGGDGSSRLLRPDAGEGSGAVGQLSAPEVSPADGRILQGATSNPLAAHESQSVGKTSIAGWLRLADGTPVPGRIVEAYSAGEGSGHSAGGTRTADDGSFALEGLAAGTYDLRPDMTLAVDGSELAGVQAGASNAEIILAAVLVQAVLPDDPDDPTDGRRLDVVPLNVDGEGGRGITTMNFRTDANGGFALLLPQGPGYSLSYRSPLYALHKAVLPPGRPSGSYELFLADSDPGHAAVQVVLRGEPLLDESQAFIELDPLDAAPEDSQFLTVHAPDRLARNGFVQAGRYAVSASLSQNVLEAWLIASASVQEITVAAGDEATIEVLVEPAGALTLTLEPTLGVNPKSDLYGALGLEVLDAGSERWRPLELAQMLGDPASQWPSFKTGGPLFPGEPRYNYDPLPVGQLRVRITGQGWRTREEALEIRPGERTLWTVRMEIE